ncbi:MAG: hypothetical protein EKK56_08285 [Flavobacteriaceae bacterium]|nr:MAG: hypothetical protein EKK56_08285 [Flavobacteriaceae bacterium]
MEIKEDYFRICKKGNIYIISDRIPFIWKEMLIWNLPTFLGLLYVFGPIVGVYIFILTLFFYILFRFASWIIYTEIQINIESGEMIKVKKIINNTQNINLITNKFDSSKFEYTELNRSGNIKFLMNYKTHKNNELLILRNKTDKEFIEKYIVEKIIIKN